MSRIGILAPDEIQTVVSSSSIATKYNEVIDRESAFELLSKKIKEVERIVEKLVIQDRIQEVVKEVKVPVEVVREVPREIEKIV